MCYTYTMTSDHALSTKTGHGSAIRLSFGLVQIPIRLHLVCDDDRSIPSRSMFTLEGNAVGYKNFDKVTGDPVDPSQIVKKALVGDTWVPLTDDEIENLCPGVKGVAEIETFIPAADFDRLYVIEKPAAWRPDTMKVGKNKMIDPAAAKAVALLSAAMAQRDVVAVAFVPSKSGGQYVALKPDGTAGYVAFATNVRPIEAAPEVECSEAEMKLAGQLIDQIGVSTAPLLDTAGAFVAEYLAKKAADPKTATTVVAAPAPAKPVDLFATLSASVDAAKAAKAKTSNRKKAA